MSQHLYRAVGAGMRMVASSVGRPKLKSDPKHGTWGYYLRRRGSDPKTNQRRQFRKTGFKTKAAAASAVAELEDQAGQGHLRQAHRVHVGRVRGGVAASAVSTAARV